MLHGLGTPDLAVPAQCTTAQRMQRCVRAAVLYTLGTIELGIVLADLYLLILSRNELSATVAISPSLAIATLQQQRNEERAPSLPLTTDQVRAREGFRT